MPIPPDRPTLSTTGFLKLLKAAGHKGSERNIQRFAKDGDFADRYPGWIAQRSGKNWAIVPD